MIAAEGNRLSHVANGQIRTDPKADLPRRLVDLHDRLAERIAEYRPQAAAVEEVFVNENPQSTLKLGQARGVVLLAAATSGIAVGEYASRLVKKAVVGTGGAEKARCMRWSGGCSRRQDRRSRCGRRARHRHHPCAPSGERTLASGPRGMIAKLRGLLDSFSADQAVIDVQGVGYLVFASSRTLSQLGAIGGEVVLHTEMQVSEDDIRLIGFATAEERDWFRLLTSVQGVGARVALAILSALTGDELHRAIAGGDKAMVARAQGVGPKLAQRIVNELKDKAGGVVLGSGGSAPAAPAGSFAADAASALQNLGFRPAEASAAVAKAEAELGPEASLDALVRAALKKAAR